MQRVSQELKGDYRTKFIRGGTVHFEHFPVFTVHYPNIDPAHYPAGFVEFVAGNLTNKCAKDTLEKEFRCLNWLRECTHLVPLYTTADDNCLLHAASLAMWGFEDRQFILRNALYEFLTTADRNTSMLKDRCQMSLFSMLRDVQVNMSDNDWCLEWQQIVNQARPNMGGHHQSLEECHIFVLANILRRPIIVYGVPKARSFSIGGTMQNINFNGVYLPLLWGSLFHHKPPLCLGYSMGHFTALVPSGSRQQQLVVPLTDNTGHMLPIRFLLQAEEQNTHYLLEKYLDIIQKYSSSLGKEVPVAIIALKEAAHMQHLVQTSIDMSLTLFNEQSQPYYAQSQPPAPSQWETPRRPCVGCNTGAYGLVETNFLCYVCYYKKQTSVAVTTGFNASRELKCRSPGCQQQGLLSKHGYYNGCYAKALNSGGEHQRNGPDTECRVCKAFYSEVQFGGLCSLCFNTKDKDVKHPRVLCKYPGCSFYADPKLDNYCQDCFDNKSGLANYKRCQNPTCSNHVPTTNASKFCDSCLMSTANKFDGMPLARVLCKYPGCSFYADPKLDNYGQDCFDNKSGLANYKRCQNPTCSNHVPTTNASKFCDSCLMSTANKSDGMPLARVLCKYPGCSFYADPKSDNYCQDCFDNKSGLANYKRCQNPTCSKHVPTTSASKFCDSCLMSTANKPDGMPRARVLCKYPGCSFYADPKLDNYCQDCFDNKSGLKNYKQCQNPTCSNCIPTTTASKFCDSCLLSSAHKYDMPCVMVLCKYPGCSFYADPKLDNYCQDCFDNKYGLIN